MIFIRAAFAALSFLKSVNVKDLNVKDLERFKLPTPPLSEQTQIVSFLNNKTQKVDDLIQKTEKKIDFDNQIIGAVTKLEEDETLREKERDKFDHIIIDEFQDCNWIQTRLAYLLTTKGHITVVGDEDQSIYGFQGANGEQNFKLFKN